MKTIHDISVLLGVEQQDYPGDPPFELRRVQRIEDGDPAELSKISMSAHAGSHIDAPAHFIPGGKTIDAYPPERFMLDCLVAHLPKRPIRGATHFAEILGATHFAGIQVPAGGALLLRTDNSDAGRASAGRFHPDFVALDESAAAWCAEQKLGLLGIDAPSVERGTEPGFPVHRILLGADVLLLEGINLASVAPGPYRLFCPPLRLAGAEAAPTRAILYS